MDPTPVPVYETSVFLRRMRMATDGVVLFVLSIYILKEFRDILQPLFVAMFIGFLTQPIHRWLVRQGFRSLLAYGMILVFVALGVFVIGSLLYANITEVSDKLPMYEKRLEDMVRDTAHRVPVAWPPLEGHFLRKIHIDPEQLLFGFRTALGRFGDFTSWAALTLLYLVFLVAEKVSFPQRLVLALGVEQGARIMSIVESINQAIGEYIAVKTLVSAMAGILSYLVLAGFGVDFAATWGILIFVLNYIPYLGSLIAVSLPIVLSFVQFEGITTGIVVTIALIGIQQIIGTFVEPRLAGQRLDVSPLLIVLSLAFWGFVWGIVGAILAVPLLVIVKIVLDNIQETKPIATLISNR